MTSKKSSRPLAELVEATQMSLLHIKRRWFVLQEAEKELKARTRDKSFNIYNDVLWAMLLEPHSMLVIDSASLARGMLEEGGLLGAVKARSDELPRGKRYGDDDPDLDSVLGGLHKAAFERLFEKAVNRKGTAASHEGVDGLRSRFSDLVRGVVDDRDRNRAHKFERGARGTPQRFLVCGTGRCVRCAPRKTRREHES